MYLSISAAPCPKRRVTIFTSSGCETSLGMGTCPFRFCSIIGQKTGHLFGTQIVVKGVVDLDRRRPATGTDTLHFLKRKQPILCDPLVPNAQLFLEPVKQIVGASQHTADVGTDLHVVFAHSLEPKHGVVSGYVAHIELRDADP